MSFPAGLQNRGNTGFLNSNLLSLGSLLLLRGVPPASVGYRGRRGSFAVSDINPQELGLPITRGSHTHEAPPPLGVPNIPSKIQTFQCTSLLSAQLHAQHSIMVMTF